MAFFTKGDLPYLGFVAAAFALRIAPRSWQDSRRLSIAYKLGDLWYRVDRPGATLARRNLQTVLGSQLSAAQIDTLGQGVFRNVALHKLLHDIVPTLTPAEVSQLLDIHGLEHLEEALDIGRGVVLMGTHFGIPGYLPLTLLEQRGFRVVAVLGHESEPEQSWVYSHVVEPVRRRSRRHFRLINPNGAPQRELADCLRRNEILMTLGDVLDDEVARLMEPYVVPAPLLGHSLPFKTGSFRLARWTGSPVVPAFILPRSGGFTMVIEPPIELSKDTSVEGLKADLASFTARFEPHLLRYPALWAHWRHKDLPDLMRPTAKEAEPLKLSTLQLAIT